MFRSGSAVRTGKAGVKTEDSREQDSVSLVAILPCQDLLCAARCVDGRLKVDVWQLPQTLPPLTDTEKCCGILATEPTNVVLKEDIPLQPKRLIPSPDGSLLCILGRKEGERGFSMVVVDIAAFAPAYWPSGKCIFAPHAVLKLSGSVPGPVDVVHAAWHPLSTHHLTVLSASQFLYVYDVSGADLGAERMPLMPVFECNLRRLCPNRPSLEFLTFCFPEQVSLSPWSALMLVLLDRSGSPSVLFPVAPRGLVVPAALGRIMLFNIAGVTNDRQREWCTGWCEEFSDSLGRPRLRFKQRDLIAEADMEMPQPALLPSSEGAQPNGLVLDAVLMTDDGMQLAVLMNNGTVDVLQCCSCASLKWLSTKEPLRWTRPLVRIKLEQCDLKTLSMHGSVYNPTHDAVVVHDHGACVLHLEDVLSPSQAVTTVSVPPESKMLGAAHWMNHSRSIGTCFSLTDDGTVMYTLCQSPQCKVDPVPKHQPEAPLTLPDPVFTPEEPKEPLIAVRSEYLEELSSEEQLNCLIQFMKRACEELERISQANKFFASKFVTIHIFTSIMLCISLCCCCCFGTVARV